MEPNTGNVPTGIIPKTPAPAAVEAVSPEIAEAMGGHTSLVTLGQALVRHGWTADEELRTLLTFARGDKFSPSVKMKAMQMIRDRILSALEQSGLFRSGGNLFTDAPTGDMNRGHNSFHRIQKHIEKTKEAIFNISRAAQSPNQGADPVQLDDVSFLEPNDDKNARQGGRSDSIESGSTGPQPDSDGVRVEVSGESGTHQPGEPHERDSADDVPGRDRTTTQSVERPNAETTGGSESPTTTPDRRSPGIRSNEQPERAGATHPGDEDREVGPAIAFRPTKQPVVSQSSDADTTSGAGYRISSGS